jgi:hypothetical protein
MNEYKNYKKLCCDIFPRKTDIQSIMLRSVIFQIFEVGKMIFGHS